MLFKVINFLAFQIAWPLTVISAANGYPYVGVITTSLWVCMHLMLLKKNKMEEALLLFIAMVTGLLFESALLFSGSVSYPEAAIFGLPAPLWMIALWVNVALTLNHCLSWINKNIYLAALLGTIFGPLAYNGGVRLGAISFDPIFGSIVIGIMWAIAMPLLIRMNRLINHQSLSNRSLDMGF